MIGLITFYTISTSHIARVFYTLVQCQQLVYFMNSLKKKIKHVYFSRLERQKTRTLSLFLSLSLSLWRKTQLARVYFYFSMKYLKTLKKLCRACAKSRDGARGSNLTSDQWLWRQLDVIHFFMPPLKKGGILFYNCWSVCRPSDISLRSFDQFAW